MFQESFKRNTPYHHVRLEKKFKFSSPNAFFAEKKEIVNESFPGDIVGVHDSGNFKIGDTFTEVKKLHLKEFLVFHQNILDTLII